MSTSEQIQLFFFFILLAALVHGVAYSKGFFKRTFSYDSPDSFPLFSHLLLSFLLYLLALLFLPLFIAGSHNAVFRKLLSFQIISLFQCLAIFFVGWLLFAFFRKANWIGFKQLWKVASPTSVLADLALGAVSWLIAFPAVAAIDQLSDLFLDLLFHFKTYEQLAVGYLKTALQSPLSLVTALIMVLFIAPCFEEFLFRGLLQTFLKRHLGRKAAIMLSALAFALFHLAPSQGLGNVSIALSLFVFSIYLGFIYERQRSLFAPIGLHLTFNAVSSIRIILNLD